MFKKLRIAPLLRVEFLFKKALFIVITKVYAWLAGVYALIVGSALVTLTNRKFIRNHAYEIFVVIHFTLAFVFVYGLWHHLNPWDYSQYLIPYFSIWSLERFIRFINMFIVFGGFRMNNIALYEEPHTESPDDAFIKLQVTNYDKTLFKVKEGQFGCVYFGWQFAFWQAHPFTLVKLESSRYFAVVMKVKKGITLRFYKKLKRLEIKRISIRVCIEGPYGHSEREFTNEHQQLCVITTGTGIAGPIGYLSTHRAAHTFNGSLNSNILHWAVKSMTIVRA